MPDVREVFQAATQTVRPDPGFVERQRRKQHRRNLNRKIGAIAVAATIGLAAVVLIVSTNTTNEGTTPAVEPTATQPTYTGPEYTLGPVTEEDIAVGKAFLQAWVDGDGEAAAAMFSPEGTFDGFSPFVLPALHDWFRAGGWTFSGGGCGIHGWGPQRGVVGCGFTFENDLTRALDMRPVPKDLSFAIEAGRIETAWFGGGGDCCHNMFGSPDPLRRDLTGPGPDLFGAVWDMFTEWFSTSHPGDFGRMYDPDYGYPVRGYPILDPVSIGLWERYTDEFVASPQALRRSFTEWMSSQSFEVQAGRICMTATEEFWATKRADDLGGAAFNSALADASEETLAELRALPLETEADRATMASFVPRAESWIELFRRAAATGADVFFERRDLGIAMDGLIGGCLITGLPG